MVTYLILKQEVHKVCVHTSTSSAKPVDSCPIPPLSPAYPIISDLLPKRKSRETSFGLFHIQSPGEKGSVSLTLPRFKMARRATMSPIALHCPKKKSSASSCAFSSGAVAAPCVRLAVKTVASRGL